ncbi:MAG TPA: phosphoribosylamine--glycine ligase [Acidimicrobiales bacterium]|nr:phosphoribosylamine--glycine ligase [Acidimicrobiales bacterium]|tara:strand:+ start:251 stop:1483 length:1233 start_codon:yes stop_codon:yes gene_type:complete
MKVCVVGSGGREHALAHVLSRDTEVIVSPGNPGIPNSTSDTPEEIDADLFVVGPEDPLVDGLADRLRKSGKKVFGPGSDGAHLEGSKAWMKQVLNEAGVATAHHGSFTDENQALKFLDTMGDLFVIKTDGLAAGKGVLVTENRAEATDAIKSYLAGDSFGDAGKTVIIEEGLTGPELSVLAICDGNQAFALSPAQDFKRIREGDTGLNTGGMGAYSPVPIATQQIVDSIMEEAVSPTLTALQKRNIDYRGVLYCGLMFTPDGVKVLEYNVRFGDPETQVVLPRLTSSLSDLLFSAASGRLINPPVFSSDAAVTVVCAAENYPLSPKKGDLIEGISEANAIDGVKIYCAGIDHTDKGFVTSGGRVLSVTGCGENLDTAKKRAYEGVRVIYWEGMQYRSDIAAHPTDEEKSS